MKRFRVVLIAAFMAVVTVLFPVSSLETQAKSVSYMNYRGTDHLYVVSTPSGLNVRTQPSTSSTRVSTIPGGTILYAPSSKWGWLQLKTGDFDGRYVSGNYCESVWFTRDLCKVTTKGSNLMLRKGPSTRFSIITGIPNGTVLGRTYETVSGWSLVRYQVGNKVYSGWVSSSYLVKIYSSR